ncbi:hypothetical protein N7539_008501 [Penicillium diatomitis]|uniref:Dynamin-type G domain-containing protein n=1 Tax=Penicillium diatomitis TaxID=2819901 RepID=A0A9W9WRI1_9EURO|nr:uncharacterized protein N7539_008501 [Penicillium diatomitis]KAJ5471932.1 hypothetical protein N7539_008501 [Penicillium diatomitis]
MVLTRFNTHALKDLCSEEQLELLNSIDTLRSQGIDHYVSLPQIIVCGDQSSGKSSVLEAISGVSFPVKSNLCTRFPTELVLRQHPRAGVRVSIVPHQTRSEVEQRCLGDFCEQLDSFEGLPMLMEKAKGAMGINTHGKAFSKDLLRVEVSGPDRPHLTIEVVQSYMQEPRSIILAVVSAKNDFANQIVLKLARSADKLGTRTLGVITKPDTLAAGSESEAMFVSLAKNLDVEFRLVWHVLRNMDMDHGQSTREQRDVEEFRFFSQGIWKDLPRSIVGITTLRGRLSTVLLSQIATELPSLIGEIEDKAGQCKTRLRQLGEPRVSIDEQKSYLMNIAQCVQELVKAAVDGTYNDNFFGDAYSSSGYQKRIRAIMQNSNEVFADDIDQTGHQRRIVEADGQQSPAKHQVDITREEYIEHICHLLKRTRGRELPGTFNPMIVRDLFLEQCSPWERITYRHTDSLWAAAQEFLILVVKHTSDEATSAALIREIIYPACDSIKQEMSVKVKELLQPHQIGHPITYNHFFTENLQKVRTARQRTNIATTLQQFFGVSSIKQSCYMDTTIKLDDLLTLLTQHSEPDMVRYASVEALDCMLAYYKVALERFVDDIANEVVEGKLTASLSRILSPVTVFDMSTGLLRNELSVLQKGLETCKEFVKLRKDGHGLTNARDLSRQSRIESLQEVATLDTKRSNISDPSTDTPNSPEIPDETVDENLFPNVEAVSPSLEPVDVVPAPVEETAILSDHEPATKRKMKKKMKRSKVSAQSGGT